MRQKLIGLISCFWGIFALNLSANALKMPPMIYSIAQNPNQAIFQVEQRWLSPSRGRFLRLTPQNNQLNVEVLLERQNEGFLCLNIYGERAYFIRATNNCNYLQITDLNGAPISSSAPFSGVVTHLTVGEHFAVAAVCSELGPGTDMPWLTTYETDELLVFDLRTTGGPKLCDRFKYKASFVWLQLHGNYLYAADIGTSFNGIRCAEKYNPGAGLKIFKIMNDGRLRYANKIRVTTMKTALVTTSGLLYLVNAAPNRQHSFLSIWSLAQPTIPQLLRIIETNRSDQINIFENKLYNTGYSAYFKDKLHIYDLQQPAKLQLKQVATVPDFRVTKLIIWQNKPYFLDSENVRLVPALSTKFYKHVPIG